MLKVGRLLLEVEQHLVLLHPLGVLRCLILHQGLHQGVAQFLAVEGIVATIATTKTTTMISVYLQIIWLKW